MPKFLGTPGMLLRGAYLTMHRRFNAHFQSHGITADQFVLLSLLGEHGGCTQRQLTTICASDANTIAAMVQRLENKGLVVRQAHPSDRRAFVLQLTATGRALRALCDVYARTLHTQLEACVPAEDRAAFERILVEIRRSMSAADPAPAQASNRSAAVVAA